MHSRICSSSFPKFAYHTAIRCARNDPKEMFASFGASFKNYRNALKTLNQDALNTRRIQLCKTFAKKCLKNPRHSDLFPVHNTDRITRQAPTKFQEINCKTARYYKSAVPYMIRMLNNLH